MSVPSPKQTLAPIQSGVMTAQGLADQATELAAKLKPGSWESARIALVSIAQSLASMSEDQTQG